jgi:hypothetical protein
MAHQIHRVKRGPKHPPVTLPKDTWQGGTFREADGTILEVKFSGQHMPQTDVIRGEGRWRKVGHPVLGNM